MFSRFNAIVLYRPYKALNGGIHGRLSLNALGDFLAGVHHRGMVAAPEGLAYLGGGVFGYFPYDVHGQLPGVNDVLGALFAL
jgi:hypothetical protein